MTTVHAVETRRQIRLSLFRMFTITCRLKPRQAGMFVRLYPNL